MTAEEPGVEAPLRADRERAESVPEGGGGETKLGWNKDDDEGKKE